MGMGKCPVWRPGRIQCVDREWFGVGMENGPVWGWGRCEHLGSGALGDNYPGRTTDPQILLDLVHSSAKVISNKGCFIFF